MPSKSQDSDKRRTPRGPRRLFSFDSGKSSSSRRTASETSFESPSQSQARGHSKFSTLSELNEDDTLRDAAWTKTDLVESPLGSEHNPFNDAQQRPESPRPAFFRTLPKLDLAKSTTASSIKGELIPPSPSSARWDHVRQHVLLTPPLHSQQPSSSSSSTLSVPRTAQAPKTSRIAQKLGFKQVVEHAREIAFDDSRKFAYDLQKACWATRFGDVKSYGAMNMHGSSLSINQLSNVTNSKTRRQSLHLQPVSLKYLYQVLLQYEPTGIRALPIENLVLSTLLIPFLTFDKGTRVDEERWFAIESFEVIRKTWDPIDEASGIERAMWCLKAAFIQPSPLRLRVLSSLWALTVPSESCVPVSTPMAFISISQGMFSLLPWADGRTEEGKLLSQIIRQVRDGSCGEFEEMTVEQDYNAIFLDVDSQQDVRDVLMVEALGKCIENAPEADRKWLLNYAVDEYWPVMPRDSSLSPLLASIHSRKLNAFSRIFCSLLDASSPDTNRRLNDSLTVIKIARERVLPELENTSTATVLEAKRNLVKAVLIMLTAEDMSDVGRWCIATVTSWYRGAEWKATFEKGLKHVIVDSPWPPLLRILNALAQVLPQDVRKLVVAFMLPELYERMVDDEPPYPCLPLTTLFATLSNSYPQLMYKPLFSCAAATKEVSIVNHLRTINSIAKFVPNFWTQNAEMMSVALSSDIGGSSGKDQVADGTWSKARLGQSMLLVELIGSIQSVRRDRESNTISDDAFLDVAKFVYELEIRLGAILQARERKLLVPPSQRLLYCVLFREARLLTRSMKSAPWLQQVVSWFIEYHDHIDEDYFHDEVDTAVTAIRELYVMMQEARVHHQRRSTMLLSATLDNPRRSTMDGQSITAPRENKLLAALAKGYICRIMKLLVTVSLVLEPEDFGRIGPIVWDRYLCVDDNVDVSTVGSASFLIMQCAEKTPADIQATIQVDFNSLDRDTKLRAIARISTLSNWRFQLASQHVITDRSRRLFKLARPILPFIATDMGSAHYVRRDDPLDAKDNLPPEMRKRLAEIGWVDDDAPVNQHMERIHTPLSLLPIQQLDLVESKTTQPSYPTSPGPSPNPSPVSSPQKSPRLPSDDVTLLRRNSSSGGPMYGIKRRAIFVPSLTRIFPMLASLVFDPDFTVAHAARATIIDLMRNDPSLIARPVLDLLADETKDVATAVTSFRAFLHVRHTLPPSMAHHIFNYLTGFLKDKAKNATTDEALQDYAYVIPILAKLVDQVSDLSLRDFRRAKIDMCFVPSGALYFQHTVSNPFMFPTTLGRSDNPFEDLHTRLVAVTMVRVSQNMLFTDMLKKNPQDIQLVRKSMTRLVLPSWDEHAGMRPLELSDFVPRVARPSDSGGQDWKLRGLSILLSRSYLPLVAQIFRSMPRHLNDRAELAVLVDGINRILVTHGGDIGIVSQALIALMVASTRFHRLFFSRGGYTLFMPAVVKVYAEAEMNSGIKAAVEYAVNRFFARHGEAFVYQSLDVMSHILALPEAGTPWVAKSVYSLFSSLKSGSTAGSDPGGIHHSTKVQEREALLVATAEEKPQTFLASVRKGAKNNITIDLPEEYEPKRLTVDNLVRLFLTVIAHDLTTIRSEQFLACLRHLAPFFYEASNSSRSVLQQGIEALSTVLLRVSPKGKADGLKGPAENSPQDVVMDEILDQQLNEKSKTPSDFVAMRLHYFSLVIDFSRAGGQLSGSACHRNTELVKVLLKEVNKDVNEAVATFLADFARVSYCNSSTSRSGKHLVAFLRDLAPIISSYALTVDFSGIFDVLAELCENPTYAREPGFSELVMTQVCAAGLEACDMAASERLLFTLHCRTSLIRLLNQAVLLYNSDVLGEIERYSPSHEFMSGVVLPLALSLKTTAEIDQDGRRPEPWHHEAVRRAWVRLSAYVMSACQRRRRRPSSEPSGLERSKSRDRSDNNKNRDLYTMVTALQALKVIVVRGGKDLGSLPDIWLRIASFLRTILAEGTGDFTFGPREYSPSPSPTPSPRASGQFDFSPATMFSGGVQQQRRTFHNPNMVDYCLWSLLELLCVHRSPLVLQLRLFMKEKVFLLDSQLRAQQNPSRPSSSVFAKPRRRQSGMPSPDSSPRVRPSVGWESHDASFFSLEPHRSPVSPSAAPPRIVHLGPNAFVRSSSPVSDYVQAKETKVKSMALIQATYRRIRVVQSCLGYQSMLVPMPNGEWDEPAPTTWTVREAVREIMNETRQLLEEFDEEMFTEGDSMVVVDAEQSFRQ